MASQDSGGVASHPSNELVVELFYQIAPKCWIPTGALARQEIIWFKDDCALHQAISGATTQRVQLDWLGPQLHLQCECCNADGSLSNSMHDTVCLAYHLT